MSLGRSPRSEVPLFRDANEAKEYREYTEYTELLEQLYGCGIADEEILDSIRSVRDNTDYLVASSGENSSLRCTIYANAKTAIGRILTQLQTQRPFTQDLVAVYEFCASAQENAAAQEKFLRILAENPDILKERYVADFTPFHRLGKVSKNTRLMDYLLSYAQSKGMSDLINSQDNWGNTPLLWAVANANITMANHMILRSDLHGIDLNLQDSLSHKNTALHLAVAKGWNHHSDKDRLMQPMSEVIENLLKYGANPNIRDIHGNTPLHLAAIAGDIQSVRTLLRYNADANVRNHFNLLPLEMLDYYTSYDVAKKVISHHGSVVTFPEQRVWEKNRTLIQAALKEYAHNRDLADGAQFPRSQIVVDEVRPQEVVASSLKVSTHYTPPIKYNHHVVNTMKTNVTNSDTPLFVSAEEVCILANQRGNLDELFEAQEKFIEQTLAQAEQDGSVFRLIGDPEVDSTTGVTIYKYHHPSAKPNEATGLYDEEDCITYYVDGSKTEVLYGLHVRESIVFAMPDRENDIGAKAIITTEGQHRIIGDTRNTTIQISQQPEISRDRSANGNYVADYQRRRGLQQLPSAER